MLSLLGRLTGDRLRRRARKKLARLEQADVVILRYPKSGVTWLRTLISRVYQLKYGIPDAELLKFDNFQSYSREIPRIFVAMDNISDRERDRDRISRIIRKKKTILLLRDPRDIAVSLYFHFAKRSTALERAVFRIPDTITDQTLFDFVTSEAHGIPAIIGFINTWAGRAGQHPHLLVVRYEDMRREPERELARVMAFLEAGASDEEIRQAVEFASFDRLKELEGQRFFSSEILQPGDEADADSFKVRRGKVKGYVDYFTESEISLIDQLVEDRLAPELRGG